MKDLPHLIDLTWYHRNLHGADLEDNEFVQLNDFKEFIVLAQGNSIQNIGEDQKTKDSFPEQDDEEEYETDEQSIINISKDSS